MSETATTTPGDVTAVTDRLHRAAEDYQAKREVMEAAMRARDQLIFEAIDGGHLSTKKAARAALISQSTLMGILARGPR